MSLLIPVQLTFRLKLTEQVLIKRFQIDKLTTRSYNTVYFINYTNICNIE